jgi:orotate phosphoribosyltransferase
MMKKITESDEIERAIVAAGVAVRGHFQYESGHHGDLWLDLDALFFETQQVRAWATVLAAQAASCRPEIVGGPLTGGAFLAQWLAAELGAGFVFAERIVSSMGPVRYRLPVSLRGSLAGRRLLLVDDAVNAGSALRATLTEALDCGSHLVGLASLLTLGEAAASLAQQHGVPFFSLASLERKMWLPAACPLCQAGLPLRIGGN